MSRPVSGHLYILASRRHGTIYIGATTDLPKRIHEHREGLIAGFTRTYGVKRLVYIETYDDIGDAIVRERRMKEGKRSWKVRRIEEENPFWDDLAVSLLGFEPLRPSHPGEDREGEAKTRSQAPGDRVHRSRPSPG
jgi:putative endonuclease